MKKTLLLLIIAATSMATTAQNSSSDWLGQLFSPEVVSSLDQSKVDYYLAADQLGYRIEDVAPKDISDLEDALSISPKNENVPELTEAILEGEFHFMLYKFPVKNDDSLYYRIGDTGKILIIFSAQHTLKKIENQAHED